MANKRRVIKQEKLTDTCPVRKKRDRFNGLTEDEVLAKKLPDHLDYDLDIVIVHVICRFCVLLHHKTGWTDTVPAYHFPGPQLERRLPYRNNTHVFTE